MKTCTKNQQNKLTQLTGVQPLTNIMTIGFSRIDTPGISQVRSLYHYTNMNTPLDKPHTCRSYINTTPGQLKSCDHGDTKWKYQQHTY